MCLFQPKRRGHQLFDLGLAGDESVGLRVVVVAVGVGGSWLREAESGWCWIDEVEAGCGCCCCCCFALISCQTSQQISSRSIFPSLLDKERVSERAALRGCHCVYLNEKTMKPPNSALEKLGRIRQKGFLHIPLSSKRLHSRCLSVSTVRSTCTHLIESNV